MKTHDVSDIEERVTRAIAEKLKDGRWRLFAHVAQLSDINSVTHYCPRCYASNADMRTVALVAASGFVAKALICNKCLRQIVVYQQVESEKPQTTKAEPLNQLTLDIFETGVAVQTTLEEGLADGTESGSLDTDDGSQLQDDRAVRGEPEATGSDQLRLV